jgi:hypothetical protein
LSQNPTILIPAECAASGVSERYPSAGRPIRRSYLEGNSSPFAIDVQNFASTPASRDELSGSAVKAGNLANGRRKVTVADFGKVVPGGMMLDATIVPEHDRIWFPTDPDPKADNSSDVFVQHVEDCPAFGLGEFLDLAGERRVDVERFAPGERVCADDWVYL